MVTKRGLVLWIDVFGEGVCKEANEKTIGKSEGTKKRQCGTFPSMLS